MNIIERIYQVFDYKGGSVYKISKKIDVSNGYFSKTRAKQGNVGSDIIEKIVNYYTDINVEWLITGNGEMLKPNVEERQHNESVANSVAPSVANQKYKKGNTNEDEEKVYPLYNEQEYNSVMRKIKFADGVNLANNGTPYYPIPVTAGNTEQLLQEEEKPTGFISIPGIYCKAYFPVVGFSFEPLIRAGDVIGIDFIDRWERLDPDSIYFIITENQRMIKRLSDDPENPDRLICISPNFKEFPIWKDEIRVIHKVIFYGRLV